MNPRLVAIAGPLTGAVFPLLNGRFSIGREETNDLSLQDRLVSRRHCVVEQEGVQFSIRDLGSANRTYVNQLPIEQSVLRNGDEIKAGRSMFLFFIEQDQDEASPDSVDLGSELQLTGSTVILRREDAVYLRPEKMLDALPQGETGKHLKSLLKIGEAVSSIRGLDALERRLGDLIFEVVRAEDGAILLLDSNRKGFSSIFQWKRSQESTRSLVLPKSIVEQALREQVAVCGNDLLAGQGLQASISLLNRRINAFLAVPLIFLDRMLGLIYLDTSDPTIRFDADHLQLLTGIAGIAAGALENALNIQQLESMNRRLLAELSAEHNMVGDSPSMLVVYKYIAKLAPTDSTTLIGGESGTGKELVARAIHRNSPRAGKPFVAINCAALTESLLESELFGHERGAFTGAVTQKKGKLEEAAGGSVFLDEVGELAPSLQAKLLRVLQEREFERVGGTRTIKADIRLIAATNRDLNLEVGRGTFRRDLFFRLNVVSLTMPPLRERREDISGLTQHFIEKHGPKSRRRILGCSEEALACMKCYDWPGNVRELENAIERAIVMGSTERILPEDLPESVAQTEVIEAPNPGTRFHETIREVKKQLVTRAMSQTDDNYYEAAKLLGLHPNNLHRLMKTLNLK